MECINKGKGENKARRRKKDEKKSIEQEEESEPSSRVCYITK